jgi:hypothetical protein
MIRFFLTFILLTSSVVSAGPLSLDTDTKHDSPPTVANFKYWFGDIFHGDLFYLGTETIAGFETELHIQLDNRRITSVLIILGPGGLGAGDCIKRYGEVIKLLNKKYGHYRHIKEIKDPIIKDLIPRSVCDPIRLGAHNIKTTWLNKKHKVVAELLGDHKGFYIEINYIFKNKKVNSKLLQIL